MMSSNDQWNKERSRSRWLKRDATLLVFGIGGTLTGFVQLIPLVAPDLPESFIRGASVGVIALTALLMFVALIGGRWAQARQVEKLRIRMIKRRRRLLKWQARFRYGSQTAGYLLGFPEEAWPAIQQLDPAAFRRARFYRFLMRLFGSHFDYEWLRFQRARNEYFAEIGRKTERIYETSGIKNLSRYDVEIGRQKGIQAHYGIVVDDDPYGLLATSEAHVKQAQARRDDDALMQLLNKADEEALLDDGRDAATDFHKEYLAGLSSGEFLRKIRDIG